MLNGNCWSLSLTHLFITLTQDMMSFLPVSKQTLLRNEFPQRNASGNTPKMYSKTLLHGLTETHGGHH